MADLDGVGLCEPLVVNQPVGQRRSRHELGRGPHLKQVEAVVGAGESGLEAIETKVDFIASEYGPVVAGEFDHYLGPLPGDSWTRVTRCASASSPPSVPMRWKGRL